MPGRDGGVRVEGLREFRRDLKRVSPEVNTGLRVELKRIGETVAAEARGAAVKRTGRYAASIRPYVAGAGVAVGSRLPQANVLHWGGTIRPRGVPITFPQRPVIIHRPNEPITRSVQKKLEQLNGALQRRSRTRRTATRSSRRSRTASTVLLDAGKDGPQAKKAIVDAWKADKLSLAQLHGLFEGVQQAAVARPT
jgi:hypothetical protein